jgi:hypothetical protein
MKNITEQTVRVDEAKVRLMAYQLWEEAGHPIGHDLDFWFKAEAQMRAIAKTAPPAPAPKILLPDSKPAAAQKAAPPQPAPHRSNSSKPAPKILRF